MDFSELIQSFGDPIFLIAQIVGVFALIVETISYQFKKKSTIVIYLVVASVIYAIHYFMLEAYSGCYTILLTMASLICVVIKDKRKVKWTGLLWAFMAASVAIGFLTFDGWWYSVLPIIIALVNLNVLWRVKDTQKLRYLALLIYGLWLIYSVCILSLPSIAADIIGIISVVVSIVRYKKPGSKKLRNKKTTKNHPTLRHKIHH